MAFGGKKMGDLENTVASRSVTEGKIAAVKMTVHTVSEKKKEHPDVCLVAERAHFQSKSISQ